MEHEEPVQVKVTTTDIRELARYILGLMGVQEVRWDKGDTARTGDYIYGQVAGSFECGYEPSGSIKCGQFLE